jgi:hypothetical protein
MALVLANRVQETTTTTGTGTITLAGAVSGYQSFAVIGNGNTTYYTITSGSAWEVGIGTYTSAGTTLARTTILASSAAGAAITLAGTSNVFADYPADRAVSTDNTATLTNKTLSLEAYSTAATVTAGTNAQGQGPLTNDINIITTTATNPSGVTLPTAFVGARITVINKGTNTVNIYPASGAAINTSATNAAISCAQDASVTFVAISTTTWYTVGGYSTLSPGYVPASQGGTGISGVAPFNSNGAVYVSTPNSLTTGTLPTLAGGTGSSTTPTAGQIPIGNGTSYTANTLTAGSGITITNGSGTVTIAASGGGGGGAVTLVGSYSASIYKGLPPFSLASLGTLTSGAGRFMIVLDGINVGSTASIGLVFGSSGGSAITSGYNFTQITGNTSSGSFTPSGISNGGAGGSNFPLTTGSGLLVGGVPPYLMSGWIEVISSQPSGAFNPTFQIYGQITFVSATGAFTTYNTVAVNGVLPGVSVTTPYFALYTSASSVGGTMYAYQVT